MPSVKTMKGLPIFLALLLVAGAAQAEKLKERFDKTLPLKAGAKVELQNVNGVVTFEAWDRAEVRIEAEKWAESKRSDVAKKALGQVRIQVSQTPGGVKIQTKMPEDDEGLMDWLLGKEVNTGADYRVFVPRQAVISASNVNGDLTLRGTRSGARLVNVNGGIAVNGVQGNVSVETINGLIALTGLDGGVKATTVNGGIDAKLSDVAEDLWFETVNGAVSLRLPAGSRMTLDASMAHGVVESDFAVEGSGGAKKRNFLKGDVNGGGSTVVVRSVNGVIQISEV
jgi:Putative adhesin